MARKRIPTLKLIPSVVPPSYDNNIAMQGADGTAIPNGYNGIGVQDMWKTGTSTANYGWNDNLLSATFINFVKDLYPGSLQHPGLASGDIEFVLINDTSLDQASGTGGLNCDATTGCVPQDGVCCPDTDFGHAAFPNMLELVDLVDTPSKRCGISHVFNVQLGAMSDLQEWIDQAVWKMEFSVNTKNLVVYQNWYGAEQNTGGNDIFYDAVGQELNPALPEIQTNVENYLTKVMGGVADLTAISPTTKHILDTSLHFETGKRDRGWRNGIYNTPGLTYDGVRQYMLHHNFSTEWTLTSDFDHNLSEVLRIKNTVIPQRLTDVANFYVGKEISLIYGLPDQDSTTIHDTILGLMFIVWTVESTLEWNRSNSQKVCGLHYQSLLGLIRQNNTLKTHYYAVKAIGRMLQYDDMEYLPVSLIDTTDLTAFATKSASQKRLMVVNYGPDVKVYTNLMYNSSPVVPTNVYTVRGTSLDDLVVIEEESATTDLTIPAYSINIYTF